jgi:hypothetical protein
MLIFITSKLKTKQLSFLKNNTLSTIIILSPYAIEQISNKNIQNLVFPEDMLDMSDLENIDITVKSILKKYLVENKFLFNNINLSCLSYYELHSIFIKYLKIIKTIKTIKQKYSSSKIKILGTNKEIKNLIEFYFKKKPINSNISCLTKLKFKLSNNLRKFSFLLRKFSCKHTIETTNNFTMLNIDPIRYKSLITNLTQKYKKQTIALSTSKKLLKKYKDTSITTTLLDIFYKSSYSKTAKEFLKNNYPINLNDIKPKEFFIKQINLLIQKRYQQYIELILIAEEFYKKNKPTGIFLWNDELWTEKIFILLAKKYNIPSIVIQHGASAALTNEPPIYADYFAVWGNISKEKYINFEIPENKLKIIGNIMLDKILTNKNYNNNLIRKNLNIKENEKLVVFPILPLPQHRTYTANLNSNEAYDLFKTVTNTAKSFPNIKLLVKCRGKQDYNVYTEWGAQLNLKNIIYSYTVNLYEILSACDFVISYYSTVALEAMIFNKLVIIADFYGQEEVIPYISMNSALKVENKQELKDIFDSIINKNNTYPKIIANSKVFLDQYLYKLDGNTGKRLVEFMESFL